MGDLPKILKKHNCKPLQKLNTQLDPFLLEKIHILKPETSKSFSVGAVWTPELIDGLILTVDFWRISQEGIIGIFGTPNHLNLDYALRTTAGGNNPNVIRLAPTQDIIDFFAGSGLAPIGEAVQTLNPYSNLESRVTRGIDFAAIYRLRDTSVGDFTFNIGATKLLSADQSPDGDALIINALKNTSRLNF